MGETNHDRLPSFLATKLDGRDPEELRAIADYLDGTRSRDVPDFVGEAAALQDDPTLAAMRSYALELAEHGGTIEPASDEDGSGDDGDGGAGADGSEDDGDDRPDAGPVSGPFFG